MKRIKFLLAGVILISFILTITSCNKKEETSNLPQQKEQYSDKEKELKDKEDFLKIKEEQLKQWEERLKKIDSTLIAQGKETTVTDTSKTVKDTLKSKDKNKEKFTQKEKELNKRLDNPQTAVGDYLEFIQRGVSDSKTFDANMKKASQVWESRTADSFKKNYKGVKKFIVTEPPTVVSKKGENATVKVKVKQTTVGSDGKEVEKESSITYNLVADKTGKWRIKSNVVK
ncbi:MAG: hypothetical protein LWX07_04025 [Bacteroidetes bacterium]|nr:hypothetical protein [Bacteroidota bacterium]